MVDIASPHVTTELIGDPTFDEYCDFIFRSVPRRDQRRKGAAYLAGVLRADGRRSLRNIAQASGAHVNEQSLHHFVSQSTWEWRSVRSTTARFLAAAERSDALVVREPGTSGEDACLSGVVRTGTGRGVAGLWGASPEVTVPLSWWQTSRAEDTAGAGARTSRQRPEAGIVQAYRDATRGTGVSVPLVLDARALSVPLLLHALGPSVPAVLRIGGDQQLRLAEQLGATSRESWVPAELLARMHGNLRFPVGVGVNGGFERMVLNLGVHVPELQPGSGVRLLGGGPMAELLCVGSPNRPWPQELWLIWGATMDVELQLHLASLMAHVDAAPQTTTARLGLGDYRSQSRDGFQRHATLIAAAQAYLISRGSGPTDVAARVRGHAPRATRPGRQVGPPGRRV